MGFATFFAAPGMAWAAREGGLPTTGIAYGPGKRQTLDVYVPDDARDAPVIVFFYGGSWQGGEKETYRFLGSALAARGFVVVIADYAVYPAVRFPGFLHDGAKAVAWAKAHAADYGGNGNKLFLMGHSAGAHIAAMLAFDSRWLGAVGIQARKDIAGFVGLAGPYDFLPIKDATLQAIFDREDMKTTQPITFVSGGEPPVFLGTAGSDALVEPGNSARLAARLRQRGGVVEEKNYPFVNHVTLVASFAAPLRFLASVRDDVADFIDGVSERRAMPRTRSGS